MNVGCGSRGGEREAIYIHRTCERRIDTRDKGEKRTYDEMKLVPA